MKSVKQKLQETKPDRVAAFEKGASEFAKKIVGNFKDYEFVSTAYDPSHHRSDLWYDQFTGESMNPDGMVALLNYREDGVTRTSYPALHVLLSLTLCMTAYLTFWKDGLKTVKL